MTTFDGAFDSAVSLGGYLFLRRHSHGYLFDYQFLFICCPQNVTCFSHVLFFYPIELDSKFSSSLVLFFFFFKLQGKGKVLITTRLVRLELKTHLNINTFDHHANTQDSKFSSNFIQDKRLNRFIIRLNLSELKII